MESEHSHGPWHVGMRPGPIVYGPLGEQIADCRSISDDDETNRLNARLIAAAPAMYTLIKDMREAFYVKGTRKALLAVMERSHEIMAQAGGK